jgi:hypothetical protein
MMSPKIPKKISVISGIAGMPNTVVCRTGWGKLMISAAMGISAKIGIKGDNVILI